MNTKLNEILRSWVTGTVGEHLTWGHRLATLEARSKAHLLLAPASQAGEQAALAFRL